MKFEIIRYTKQFTGEAYFKIHADGHYVDGSVSSTLEEAEEKLRIALLYLESTEEIIKTVEI
jgi:hypothetical protein